MRNRIFLIFTLIAFFFALGASMPAFADEAEEQKMPDDFKLRDYLPSYAPLYAEINKPFEFLKEFATWEYLDTVLKLNLKSEKVPYVGNLYNMLETVKILTNALHNTEQKDKKNKDRIEIIRSIEFAIPRFNIMALDNPNPTESLVVLVKVHQYVDVISQLVILLQAEIEKFEIVEIEQYRGFALIEFNANESKIYISMLKNGHILITWNKKTLTKLVDTIFIGKMKKSLTEFSTYKSAIQSMLEKKSATTEEKSVPQIKVYVYLRQILQLLSFALRSTDQMPGELNPLDFGVTDIHALCLNLYFENERMHESLSIVLPEKRKGIFGFFPEEPCKFNFAKYVPENVSSVYFAQTDVMRVFTQFLNVLQKVQPDIAHYAKMFIESAEAFGYNVIEETFKSMKGEFCWWSKYDEKGKLAEATYLMEATNEKLCNYLITELIKNLSIDYFTTVEKSEYKDVKYHIFGFEQALRDSVLQFPYELSDELQEPVEKLIESRFYDKLYIAFHKGKLILTTRENQLKTLIDNPEGIEKSLAQNERFKKKASTLIKDQASSMLYCGDKTFVHGWYDFVHTLLSQQIQGSSEINLEFPSKKVFADSFTPFDALSLKSNKNSIEIRTSGLIAGTAITLASFAIKTTIKKEVQKRLKKFYNKYYKK